MGDLSQIEKLSEIKPPLKSGAFHLKKKIGPLVLRFSPILSIQRLEQIKLRPKWIIEMVLYISDGGLFNFCPGDTKH